MSSTEDAQVGARVKEFRDAAGLSQAQLAQRLLEEGIEGIYPQTITKIEAGSRALRYTEAAAMARILGVSTDDFSPAMHSQYADRAAERQVRRYLAELEGHAADFHEAAGSLVLARARLARAVAAARASAPDVTPVPGLLDHAEAELAGSALEAILREPDLLLTDPIEPGQFCAPAEPWPTNAEPPF